MIKHALRNSYFRYDLLRRVKISVRISTSLSMWKPLSSVFRPENDHTEMRDRHLHTKARMGGHTHCCGFGVVVDLKIEISRGMLNSMWVMCTISLTSLGSFSEASLSSLLAAGDAPKHNGTFQLLLLLHVLWCYCTSIAYFQNLGGPR